MGNLILFLTLALPPLVRTRREERRPRCRHRRRRHLRRRVGSRPQAPGVPCSCRASRLVQGGESPLSSCVATPATSCPKVLTTQM
jgi:hypothetical protein